MKTQERICCRCGADKKEARRLGIGCSAWGKSYKQHMWQCEDNTRERIREERDNEWREAIKHVGKTTTISSKIGEKALIVSPEHFAALVTGALFNKTHNNGEEIA